MAEGENTDGKGGGVKYLFCYCGSSDVGTITGDVIVDARGLTEETISETREYLMKTLGPEGEKIKGVSFTSIVRLDA